MNKGRRDFIRLSALGGSAALFGLERRSAASVAGSNPDTKGMLVDLTLCVGCRKCEKACNEINKLPKPAKPFEDQGVFKIKRRMTDKEYTVVNRYTPDELKHPAIKNPVFAKIQCMHCNDPACVSACIVGALQKRETGAVIYDATMCIGCRYCMVACPFQVPAYEYYNALAPQVRKCTFCEPLTSRGQAPACASACPKEALTFGPREKLLELARRRISRNPQGYVGTIYGEKEVGGTSIMYLSPVPFTSLGFLSLPEEAPPRLTEKIQHGVFKYAIIPAALYALLGIAMYTFRDRRGQSGHAGKERAGEMDETEKSGAQS